MHIVLTLNASSSSCTLRLFFQNNYINYNNTARPGMMNASMWSCKTDNRVENIGAAELATVISL